MATTTTTTTDVSYKCSKEHPMKETSASDEQEDGTCSICLVAHNKTGVTCPECQFSVCNSCSTAAAKKKKKEPAAVCILDNPQGLSQKAQDLLWNKNNTSLSEEEEKPMDLLQQALTLRQSVLGDDHPAVQETHVELARAWACQRHYALALEHYGQANNVSDKEEITRLLDIAVETANSAMMQGMEAQAKPQTLQALEQFDYAHGILGAVVKYGGLDDDETTRLNTLALCDVCRVIASVHVSQSEYERALPFLQQGYDVVVPLLGKEDPRTLALASDRRTVEKLAQKRHPQEKAVEEDKEEVLHWFQQEDYEPEREAINSDVKGEGDSSTMGVTVDWIKTQFWKQVQAAQLDQTATMQQVIDTVIQPAFLHTIDKEHKGPAAVMLSYANGLLHTIDREHKGPASVMLSYANESTVADIVNTLDDYCRTQELDDRTVYVWMDCLCGGSNTTSEEEEKESTSSPLKTRIANIGHVLAILTPWWSPLAWNQACLEQISLAHQTKGCKLTLVLPPAQTVAVSDALVGDPSVPIAQLYLALDRLPVHQQQIFRPWIRNVLQEQIKEHCQDDAAFQQSSRSLLVNSGDGEETEEQAFNVFKLQLCNKMGLLFWQYGEYKTALELLEDALGVTETMYGESHESKATVYQNIANVLSDMGRYTMALETYLSALQILETTHSQNQNHPRIANLCTKLGNLYRITETLDKAMEYHQRALKIQVKLHGSTNNLAAADSYKDMGNVFFSKGDNDAALMEFRKALSIQQSILEPQHPTLAATHNHIGMVLKTKGDYECALKEHRAALAIQEESLGEDHVQSAMTYGNIASVLRFQDDWEGSLELCTKSKEIYDICLGANHPTTAAAWHTMGVIQNELDLVDGALQSYRNALEIRQSVLGMEHPLTAETLQSIGTLLFEIGDLDEALVELRKAFDIVEPLLGIEHPTTKGLADTINAVLEA